MEGERSLGRVSRHGPCGLSAQGLQVPASTRVVGSVKL